MKKLLAAICLLLLLSVAMAHEFWLQPDRYLYQPGDPIHIRFQVGENFEGDNWKGNRQSIESLQLFIQSDTDDLADQIKDSVGDSLLFHIYDEGTYLLAYQSVNKSILIDSAKFLEYLKEDGLTNAIEYRELHHEVDSPGREQYQRSSKTLVQVGQATSPVFKKATGLPVDIIPQVNPYQSLKEKKSRMTVKILYQGDPLTNQLIKVWHRHLNKTDLKSYTTDSQGLIHFEMDHTGKWMVSTVKMERLENNPDFQWQSYWGSCNWGYN